MTTLATGMPIQYAYRRSRNSICPLPTHGLSFTNMPTLGLGATVWRPWALRIHLCPPWPRYAYIPTQGLVCSMHCLYATPGLGMPKCPPVGIGLDMPIFPPGVYIANIPPCVWECLYGYPGPRNVCMPTDPRMHCQYAHLRPRNAYMPTLDNWNA
jgi:hypothetical protein